MANYGKSKKNPFSKLKRASRKTKRSNKTRNPKRVFFGGIGPDGKEDQPPKGEGFFSNFIKRIMGNTNKNSDDATNKYNTSGEPVTDENKPKYLDNKKIELICSTCLKNDYKIIQNISQNNGEHAVNMFVCQKCLRCIYFYVPGNNEVNPPTVGETPTEPVAETPVVKPLDESDAENLSSETDTETDTEPVDNDNDTNESPAPTLHKNNDHLT